MSKFRRQRELRDAYRFPGFVPMPVVHGVFGDAHALVVQLHRRQKKRLVGFVVNGIGATMTRSFNWSVICPVAARKSICHLSVDVSDVIGAAK